MLEISIIIPVYNAESYIERCLQSIISSSAPEGSYEIIAVDDSSSDRSLEVLQKMEEQIPQLHVYHRRKAGPGGARNLGVLLIYHCQGMLFLFLGMSHLVSMLASK